MCICVCIYVYICVYIYIYIYMFSGIRRSGGRRCAIAGVPWWGSVSACLAWGDSLVENAARKSAEKGEPSETPWQTYDGTPGHVLYGKIVPMYRKSWAVMICTSALFCRVDVLHVVALYRTCNRPTLLHARADMLPVPTTGQTLLLTTLLDNTCNHSTFTSTSTSTYNHSTGQPLRRARSPQILLSG